MYQELLTSSPSRYDIDISRHFLCSLFAMDCFFTIARFGLSGASTSKRKAPNWVWLKDVEVTKSIDKNGMSVQCLHCKHTLKGSTTHVNEHTPTGASKSCLQKVVSMAWTRFQLSSKSTVWNLTARVHKERHWLLYDWVVSKKRNRLTPKLAVNGVYITQNLYAVRTLIMLNWFRSTE